ncbi:sodium/hydrogen exchanger 6 [Thecamonas trahens ATCC 50062]|uniref:Sodium/hydrogen exchanger n=1 Tax=Thecamonas trahens ATCC 50062 TaxID=461836 RepID=A0A0L0D409_THETB|nr:sodium/hydrogen exchanger 6 [Thecamonas trahens ATCC 50062]KNC47072.1 sodium/hydrogen exchanger 6 [Thecamonas trahens ATCC 50062]|eukprot:XP_013759852.1 sodium/hydrogen exchanger 6 [Thecamonas trahens ATCC 50062]
MSAGVWELDSFFLELFLMFAILVILILFAYFLRHHQVRVLHETGVAVVLGAVIGKIIRLAAPEDQLTSFVSFSSRTFYVAALPPIIFNSGYNMKRRRFFTNLSPILTYAFCGTILAFAATSLAMIALGSLGLHSWSNVECFIFGSLISATDPVSTLAIMESTPVSEDLFAIVLGESVFNDAVAIVLHTTTLTFLHSSLSAASVVAAILFFLGVFIGSVCIGLGAGLLTSYILKVTRLRDHPYLEQSFLMAMAYAAYFLAQGLDLSGIVTILFCGVTMAHYAYANLRPSSRKITKSSFHFLSYIAETFVFLYLGFALFAFPQDYNVLLIVATALVLLVTRGLHIFPFGFVLNKSRSSRRRLSPPMLKFLWFAGLRGAIAFALAIEMPTENATSVRTVTLVLALASILGMGGATYPVLSMLGLVTLPDGPEDIAADDTGAGVPLETLTAATPDGILVGSPANVPIAARARHERMLSRSENFFITFDRRYLKPLFVRNYAPHAPRVARETGPSGLAFSRSISSHSSVEDAVHAPSAPGHTAVAAAGAVYVPRGRWGNSSSGSGSATLADLDRPGARSEYSSSDL